MHPSSGPDQTATCDLGHENLNNRPNGLIPPPLHGQPEYASWCSVKIDLLSGGDLQAQYGTEAPFDNPAAHRVSTSQPATIN
jgi:hypothetical protein